MENICQRLLFHMHKSFHSSFSNLQLLICHFYQNSKILSNQSSPLMMRRCLPLTISWHIILYACILKVYCLFLVLFVLRKPPWQNDIWEIIFLPDKQHFLPGFACCSALVISPSSSIIIWVCRDAIGGYITCRDAIGGYIILVGDVIISIYMICFFRSCCFVDQRRWCR